jgi:hypothetical protein
MTNIPNQSGSMQQFANPLATGGFFGLEQVGNSINTTTAIPEPSTYVAAIGLLALMLWPLRHRLIKDAKSILGLRPPMRDKLAGKA